MNVSKKVTEFVKENPGKTIEVIAVGKQAQKIASRNGLLLLASFDDFSETYSSSEVRSLLQTIFSYFDSGEYVSVSLAYTEFISSLSFEAKTESFIPPVLEDLKKNHDSKEENLRAFAQYSFEPSEQEVLNTVVPAVLMTLLYQSLLEASASEHSSRVSAMRNATDNAKEMGEELKINYNRARQAAITQEIAEIVGGSSAVS